MGLICTLVFLLFAAGTMLQRWSEQQTWNNGICLLSNMPWIQVDSDSSGSRLYSDRRGNYCWISWGVDK